MFESVHVWRGMWGRTRPHIPAVSRLAVWLPLTGCVLVGALYVGCAPASALIDRGHVFGLSWEGSGEAALSDPSAVAVDEATGEVYVVDSGHERVERFEPDGTGGYVFRSAFSVDSPGAIAVDNAPGSESGMDVYVVGAAEAGAEPHERDYLYKFTASGEKLSKKSVYKAREDKETRELELEDIEGLAVDASGTLWVYWGEEGNIDGFSDAEVNKWLPSLTPPEYEGGEAKIEAEGRIAECSASPAFAVAPNHEAFYVG